jgi:6-phosphogluconate dehydrogenase
MTSKSQIGLIGLAVMGSNFARNFASKGINIAVFNRTFAKTQEFLAHKYENIVGFESLAEFVSNLERPRKIILLVKSGQPVNDFVDMLKPHLDEGDIILDCGNSNWKDTKKRQFELVADGLDFIGCGISGGEEGALHGPSIMPGGKKEAIDHLLPLFGQVASKDFSGRACVTNVGLSSSGHFVKMVHNGIEYAIMQAIAEIYYVLKKYGQANTQIQQHFSALNKDLNKSFLLDITTHILGVKDTDGGDLLDKIDFGAGAKGTGKWTVEAGMDLGIALPNIYAALNARVMSARTNNFKVSTSSQASANSSEILDITMLNSILEATFLTSYLQGLDLIIEANNTYDWQISISEVCRIWQGGCIIRSSWLNILPELLNDNTKLTDLLIQYRDKLAQFLPNIKADTGEQVPLPVIHSTQDYLVSILNSSLPQNLTQAQRDYFGAHTYKRVDKPGVFTGGWNG